MKRRVAVVMSAVSIGVIGFSLRAGAQPASSVAGAAQPGIVQPGTVQPSASPSMSPTARPTTPAPPTPKSPLTRSPAPKIVTVNGASVDTDYGPVQVQLKLSGSKIIAATAINYPRGSNRDQAINSYAIPILQQDTLAKQSAGIDTVSGATYTSDGYRQSLQSALDAAHQVG